MSKVKVIRRSDNKVVAVGELRHSRKGVFYVEDRMPLGNGGRFSRRSRIFRTNKHRLELAVDSDYRLD